MAEDRLALTPSGQVRYTLKIACRDGTTQIVLEPLDFIARLAAQVPPPRMHLTRYHGVFAPHSRRRRAAGIGVPIRDHHFPAGHPGHIGPANSWGRVDGRRPGRRP